MSGKSITLPSRTDHSFDSELTYNYGKGKGKFKGIYLKQDIASFIHGNEVDCFLRIRYMVKRFKDRFYNCLLETVKLTKTAGFDKYGYRGYGIEFNAYSQFSSVKYFWSC